MVATLLPNCFSSTTLNCMFRLELLSNPTAAIELVTILARSRLPFEVVGKLLTVKGTGIPWESRPIPAGHPVLVRLPVVEGPQDSVPVNGGFLSATPDV